MSLSWHFELCVYCGMTQSHWLTCELFRVNFSVIECFLENFKNVLQLSIYCVCMYVSVYCDVHVDIRENVWPQFSTSTM